MALLERAEGGMRLRLDPAEVEVLASLAEGLALRLEDEEVGGPDDEVLRRLAPEVSRGDAEVDAELRGMLRGELLSARAVRLRDLASTLRPDSVVSDAPFDRILDREVSMRIVEAVNDLRIALAATIGYETLQRDALSADDQRGDAVQLLDALAWLQGGLIDFIDGDD
jgi:hypothetical protein